MHPALSVVFLTTLIGVGQGLFLALYTVQVYATVSLLSLQHHKFYAWGAAIALVFLVLGLVASFFHLGRPERAWRAAARWRTSWLSREVLVLPALMASVALYGFSHYYDLSLGIFGVTLAIPDDVALVVGAFGALFAFALFLCTGMIYACIKFLQEWATWLTVVNYTLFGLASGFLLATAFAAVMAPELVPLYAFWSAVSTLTVLVTRVASLIRNHRLRPKSTLQTAIGVRHTRIVQKSQGFMGGSFNTREFFHGVRPALFRSLKWVFLVLVFPLPLLLLGLGLARESAGLLAAAFAVQYLGLLVERWFFFAQSNHPQNLYYQTVS